MLKILKAMKNNILTIFITIIMFSAHAQTSKGTKMIGGNAGFSFSKDREKVGRTTTDGYGYSELYLNPNVGIFIIDNLAVGAKLNMSAYQSRLKDGLNLGGGRRDDYKSRGTSLTLGPWARYYFPVGTKSAFFGEVNTGFGFRSNRYNTVDGSGRVVTITNPTSALFQLGLGPGYTYFITENVGLEGLLQFRLDRSSHKPDNDDREITTNSGLFFNVGLQIYL